MDMLSGDLFSPTTIFESFPISDNAQQIINKRYSRKDENGIPQESWADIVERVITHVSKAETSPESQSKFLTNTRNLMLDRKFLPNTPCLVNAGINDGGLAGCYVLPVPDSIRGIMKAASDAAIIHQGGGGTGFSFETLRPANSLVRTTNGVASGPISFMEIFDKVTDVVKQGGVRRGANMGIMRCDHPDILRFIHAKNDQHSLTNFNISVTITDEFMKAVESGTWIQTKFGGKEWTEPVFDPIQNDEYEFGSPIVDGAGKINASAVWERIVESAHKYAEPGVIFIDTVNRHNLLRQSMGDIIATNPCAEQALHPYNSCNLGSLDVAKFYNSTTSEFEWDKFNEAVYWSVRFLDNVIDVANWIMPEIEDVVKRTRPVGLGIMGFADLLLMMGIKYGSEESSDFLNQLTYRLTRSGWIASCTLGREKGAFPEFYKNSPAYYELLNRLDVEDQNGFMPRNYEVTTIAPTGTISLVAETSSGIEPNFSWSHTRRDTVGERTYYHPMAMDAMRASDDGSLPEYFVTAHDLSAKEHLLMLAAAQQNIDNGVSKTCNAHADDSVESVDELYKLAHQLGVKAVSYYRDSSRENQVLNRTESEACSVCGGVLIVTDKCKTCPSCGNGECSI